MTTIEQMIMFLKAIYIRDEVIIKIPITFFKEVGQILEIERKARETLKSKAYANSDAECNTMPNHKSFYRAMGTKAV